MAWAWASWLQKLVLVLAVLCIAAVRGETPAERCAGDQLRTLDTSFFTAGYNSDNPRTRRILSTVPPASGPSSTYRDVAPYRPTPVLLSGTDYLIQENAPTQQCLFTTKTAQNLGGGQFVSFQKVFLPCSPTKLGGTTFAGIYFAVRYTCNVLADECEHYKFCPCTSVANAALSACVDFDECTIDHGCPADSSCVNEDPGYSCRCNTGFVALGSNPKSANVEVSGTCAVGDLTVLAEDDSQPTSLVFRVPTTIPAGRTFELSLEQFFSESSSVTVTSFTSRRFTTTELTNPTGFLINKLSPGLAHRLSMVEVFAGVAQEEVVGVIEGVTTSCACDGGADRTGTPGLLVITQLDGLITFDFADKSMCEEAFSFKRFLVLVGGNFGAEVSFTADHYHHSASACSAVGVAVQPGQQAADNLLLSKLAVGSVHQYCVEAVRTGFAPSGRSCSVHTIAWEASISGRVTLKKSAGLLPVENVTAHWRLLSSLVDGTVLAEGSTLPTEASGQFSVAFNINDQDLTNDIDYPFEIYFTKTTDSGASPIEHTFLCEDETEDCSGLDDSIGKVHVVYLRHLDFKVPVVAVDDTSEDVRGKVVVVGTEFPGSIGCPIFDVEVCATAVSGHGAEAPGACVQTNSRGEYALPVTTGTTVRLEVSYNDHTFVSLHPTYDETRGVRILADGTSYADFDFVDTTMAPVHLQVVGGGCDSYIGDSVVTVLLENCPLWPGADYPLVNAKKGTVQAIAHRVQLRLSDVTQPNGGVSRSEVLFALSERLDLDLTEGAAEEEGLKLAEGEQAQEESQEEELIGDEDELALVEAEEAKDANKTTIAVARFQYDGTPQLSVTFIGADAAGACTSVNGFATEGDSFHAIAAPRFSIQTRIDVVLDLGDVGGIPVTCDNVGTNFDIRVTNHIGLLPVLEGEQPSAQELADRARMEEKLPNLLADVERCNAGCVQRVVHDELVIGDTTILQRAHVLLSLGVLNPAPKQALGGSPTLDDIQDLFTKTLTVQTLATTAASVTHVARVLLYGDFALGQGPSIPLPTHKPALVLRDPPGGNSFAYYDSIQTHIRVDVHKVKRFAGFKIGGEVGFGTHSETDFCSGLGVAICNSILTTDVDNKVGVHIEDEFLADLDDFRNKGTYTARYSFKTSDDAWLAGSLSDVFLVPSVFVAYVDTVVSSWESETCTADAVTTDTFDVDKGRPSLTFAPVHAIRTIEVPALEAKIAQNQALVDAGTADETDTRSLLNQQAALASWGKALAEYDETNAEAAKGADSKLIRADKWYKAGLDYEKDNTKGMKVLTSDLEPVPVQKPNSRVKLAKWEKVDGNGKTPKSGLLPSALAKSAVALEPVLDAEGNPILPSQGEDQLGTTNIFTFYGGGSQYEFELDHGFSEYHEYLTGTPKDNSEFEGEGETSHDFDLDSFGAISLEIELGRKGRVDREERIEKTDDQQDTRGFVLGDPDAGDKFDVEVHLDPKYGTFVFTTLGGRSRCPYEGGTTQRQAAQMTVLPPAGPVLPGDIMAFDVELTNTGFDLGSFELEANNSMNSDGLQITLNSGELTRPVTFETIGPQETIKATITVERGPIAFGYEPVQVSLRPQCESIDRVGEGSLALAEFRSIDAISLYNSGDPDDVTGTNPAIIKFEEPCPGIELFGEMQRTGQLVVNAGSASTVTVTARNLEKSAGSYLARASSGRLEHAGLFFQPTDAVDKTVWSRAELPGGEGIDIDFASADVDNEYGFHTALWSVQEQGLPDGFYELEARTTCVNTFGAPDDFDLQTSSRIRMVVDTIFPRVFGAPEPASGVLYPGQAVVVLFDEPIACGSPFIFDLDVRVPDLDPTLLAFNSLQVDCEDRTIRFTYDAQDAKLQAGLYGKELHFTLSGVEDLHGNPAADFDYSFTFASLDLDAAATEFVVEVEAACDAPSLPALETQLLGDLTAMISTVDASRIVITELRCSAAGTSVIASVTILPVGGSSDSNSTGTRRRSLQGAEDHAMDAYTSLADTPNLLLLGGAANVKGFQLIVSDDDKAQAQATTSTLVLPDERAAEQIQVLEAKLDAESAQLAEMRSESQGLQGEIRIVLGIVLTVTVGGFIAATAMVVHRFRRSSSRNYEDSQRGSFGPKLDRISSSNPTYSSDNVADAYSRDDIPDIEAVEADEV